MPPTIDVHCHLFNHAHLPVEAIARAFLYDLSIPRALGSRGADLFRKLVDMLALLSRHEPGARFELAQTEDPMALADGVALAFIREMGASRQYHSQENTIFSVMPASSAAPPSGSFYRKAEALTKKIDEFLNDLYLQHPELHESLLQLEGTYGQTTLSVDLLPRARHKLIRRFVLLFISLAEGLDFVRFLLTLLVPVATIWNRLQDEYKKLETHVDLWVHLMMDMEPGYGDGALCGHPSPEKNELTPPRLSFRQQIDEMADLTLKARGRLAGFVPFDPQREKALDWVKYALDQGLLGVKIYPSMGFRPLDRRFENALCGLYDHCSKKGIPIITHCAPYQFQPTRGYGNYSNPGGDDGQGWYAVLERYPNLRICFAHAGEGHNKNFDSPCPSKKSTKHTYPGWYDPCDTWFSNDGSRVNPRCWAPTVLALCQKYKNTYCDFSFMWKVVFPDIGAGERVMEHLRCVLGSPDGPHLARRLMFGSDWPMPGVLGRADHIFQSYRAIFQDEILAPYAREFFGLNAIRFLNLEDAVARFEGSGLPSAGPTAQALEHWSTLAAQANEPPPRTRAQAQPSPVTSSTPTSGPPTATTAAHPTPRCWELALAST